MRTIKFFTDDGERFRFTAKTLGAAIKKALPVIKKRGPRWMVEKYIHLEEK